MSRLENKVARAHMRSQGAYLFIVLWTLLVWQTIRGSDLWHTEEFQISDHHTAHFVGYSDALNWMFLPLLLVASVFFLRLAIVVLIGSKEQPPPLATVACSEEARDKVLDALQSLRSRKTLVAVALASLLINIVDAFGPMRQAMNPSKDGDVILVCNAPVTFSKSLETIAPRDKYVQQALIIVNPDSSKWPDRVTLVVPCTTSGWGSAISEPDWTVMSVVRDRGNTGLANPYTLSQISLNAIAYTQQLFVTFCGIWLLVIVFGHNITYLKALTSNALNEKGHVVQNETGLRGSVRLNFFDRQGKFGLGDLDASFGMSVCLAAIAGVVLLFSRWHNAAPLLVGAEISKLEVGLEQILGLLAVSYKTLPDFGQVVLVVSFMLILVATLLPCGVKLLPMFRGRKNATDVFAIMMPVGPWSEGGKWTSWPSDESERSKHLDQARAKFREQYFWPTGSVGAWAYFWFIFYVALNVFCPAFTISAPLASIGAQAVLLGLSLVLAGGFLKLVNLCESLTLKE